MTDRHRLPWNDYHQVSADELKLLHAGPHLNKPGKDAYVAIGRRDDWNLVSLPVHRGLDQYLPNFIESMLADVLEQDSFATMNSMFRPGHRDCRHPTLLGKIGPEERPWKEAYRRSDAIARLNACYVDVDCHQLGLTKGQVIGAMYDAQSNGTLPTPSYLKDSGRGLWICWLLGLEDRSYRNQVAQWKLIQAKLAMMFASYGSDHNSGVDPCRLSRIVGSVNTKTEDNQRATMMIFAKDASGKAIRYTLDEMARRLNIEPVSQKRIGSSGTTTLTQKQKGWMGQLKRWKLDESRFWLLVETLRGTVPVGTRNSHHLVIGSILRLRYKYEPDALPNALEDAARRLWKRHPKVDKEFTLDRVRLEIKQAAYGRQVAVMLSGQTIANRLRVTTAEAEQIRDLIPNTSKGTWPAAADQEPLRRPMTAKERRQRVKEFIVTHKLVDHPSDRDVVPILADVGIDVSRELVRRIRLEIRSQREPSPSKPTTPPLPMDVDPVAALNDALAAGRRRHGLET